MKPLQLIRQRRENLGLSIKEMADAIGITPEHVWDLESYEDDLQLTLSLQQILQLSALLQLHPQQLAVGDDEPIRTHRSPTEMCDLISSKQANEGDSLEQVEDKIGWELDSFLNDPTNVIFSMNIDFLKDVCDYIGQDFVAFIPVTLPEGPPCPH